MYNLASKLLAPMFDPLTLAILLALGALCAWKRRRLSIRLLIISVALLLVFTSSFVARPLVHSLEDRFPDLGMDAPSAQAIVVLGGSIHLPSTQHHLSGLVDPSDRLLVAFRLYRAGKAP